MFTHFWCNNYLTNNLIGALASTNGFYGRGTVPIFLTSVSCSGNEINLLSCPREGLGGTVCNKNHAAVLCPGELIATLNKSLQCSCITIVHVTEAICSLFTSLHR